jgi:predicted transcriptional regulator
MKVSDIVEKLRLTVFGGEKGLTNDVSGGYVSDLLSDVMGNAGEGNLWVTLQTHNNVMAVASLRDLAGVILVKGLTPGEDTLAQSNRESIPLMGSDQESFELAGRLYELLKIEE